MAHHLAFAVLRRAVSHVLKYIVAFLAFLPFLSGYDVRFEDVFSS